MSADEATGFPAISFAFQPIVDAQARTIFAHEALVRTAEGGSAGAVFAAVADADLLAFDRHARCHAVDVATRVGLDTSICLNCLPGSLEQSHGATDAAVDAANASNHPLDRLIIEVTESDSIRDRVLFTEAVDRMRRLGVRFAIDDFGDGYAGLRLLADFQPDIVKLDMKLLREIHWDGPRQAIVRGVLSVCLDLGIDVIAEGIESVDEYRWCADHGIRLFQGYLFARPAFEGLAEPVWP